MISVKEVYDIIESPKLTRLQKRKMLYSIFEKPKNFFVFCKVIMPHAFTKKFAKFHMEVINEFMKDGDSAMAAPRGHAKSTLIGLGYLMWLIAYEKEKYIIYTSQNHSKSVQFLEPLTYEIKNNPVFKFIYGVGRLMRVREKETGIDRQDVFDYNYMRIQALSFEKNIRGLKYYNVRPTLILLDDIETDERVINPELRVKDADKLNKQIIPSLDTDSGRVKMIGTILHHDSQLVQKIRNLDGKIYKAIGEDGALLWGDMFTQEKLDSIKHRIGGAAFASEYMNSPVDDTFALIKREWMIACCDETRTYGQMDKYEKKIQGVDFAFSDRITADKSAYVTIGCRGDGYDVVDVMTRKGMSITEQFDYIEYLSGINKVYDNALEENSIRSMSKELKKYKFPFTLFWTAASDSPYKQQLDPDFDNKRYTVGKTAMINRLATQFENRRIMLPYKTDRDKATTNQLIDECSTYALQDGKLVEIGVHGDIPIALGYAIERAEMERNEFEFGMLEI